MSRDDWHKVDCSAADLVNDMDNWQCCYCGGPAAYSLMLPFGPSPDQPNARPSALIGYWLCEVCRLVNWDNPYPLDQLRKALDAVEPPPDMEQP